MEGNEKVKNLKNAIAKQGEEHKLENIFFLFSYKFLRQMILHIETLGMMTKYQLVFIKLESSLFKVNHIVDTRETLLKCDAFYSILNFIKFNEMALIYKKKLVTNKLKKTLSNKLFSPINLLIKKAIAGGFYKIYEYSKIFSNQKKLNDELNLIKEENSLNLYKKDQDLKILSKKSEELSSEIQMLKVKENEYTTKIKLQDHTIFSLQQEGNMILEGMQPGSTVMKKNLPLNEGNSKVKALEQKVKY